MLTLDDVKIKSTFMKVIIEIPFTRKALLVLLIYLVAY